MAAPSGRPPSRRRTAPGPAAPRLLRRARRRRRPVAAAAAGRREDPGSRCAGPTRAVAIRRPASRSRTRRSVGWPKSSASRPMPLREVGVYVYQAADPVTGRVEFEYDHVLVGASSVRFPASPPTRPRSPPLEWVTATSSRRRLSRSPTCTRRGWPGSCPPGGAPRHDGRGGVLGGRGGPAARRRCDHAADLASAVRAGPVTARARAPPPVHRAGHRTPRGDAAPDRRGRRTGEAARWARLSSAARRVPPPRRRARPTRRGLLAGVAPWPAPRGACGSTRPPSGSASPLPCTPASAWSSPGTRCCARCSPRSATGTRSPAAWSRSSTCSPAASRPSSARSPGPPPTTPAADPARLRRRGAAQPALRGARRGPCRRRCPDPDARRPGPPTALAAAVRRTGPAAVLVWSQTRATGDPAQLEPVARGAAPPASSSPPPAPAGTTRTLPRRRVRPRTLTEAMPCSPRRSPDPFPGSVLRVI